MAAVLGIAGCILLRRHQARPANGNRMLKTTHALIRELEIRSTQIAAMGLTASLPDTALTGELINLANRSADLDRMAHAINALIQAAHVSFADAEAMVRNLVVERHFYGSYCELGAYEWLHRNHAAFDAQVNMTGANVLNLNGCTIDGKFRSCDEYFDIKAFGLQAYVAEMFRKALEQRLVGLNVTIDGSMDVAVKDIDTHAFGQLLALAQKLKGGGSETIAQLNWTIRARSPQHIVLSEHTIDPYRLARENRYYPFKTAGQFTRNAPFLLIFAYAAQFNQGLVVNFVGSTDITLRALARRVFIELTSDPTPANQFDRKVAQGMQIAQAAKLISGLLFLNLDNDDAWLFLNPRATHSLTKYHVAQIFDFSAPNSLGIDDFADDNY
jgi:hypothetical protein